LKFVSTTNPSASSQRLISSIAASTSGSGSDASSPEPAGMIDDGPPALLVHRSRQISIAEHAWRRHGEVRQLDVQPVEQRHVLGGRPRGDVREPVGLVVAGGEQGVAVDGR
jgi:hypothetical protein